VVVVGAVVVVLCDVVGVVLGEELVVVVAGAVLVEVV
jgi:hypothetical protein